MQIVIDLSEKELEIIGNAIDDTNIEDEYSVELAIHTILECI